MPQGVIQLWGTKLPFRSISLIPGAVGEANGNSDLRDRAFLKCFKWQHLVGVTVSQKCSERAQLKGRIQSSQIRALYKV